MGAVPQWVQEPNVPRSLWGAHERLRVQFRQASMEGGSIGEAARAAARLCLPHFEWEEKSVFPALTLLPDLAKRRDLARTESLQLLIEGFASIQETLGRRHQAIRAAADTLLHAANKKINREFAELAHSLKAHESLEDEVLYPVVTLIGRQLREFHRAG